MSAKTELKDHPQVVDLTGQAFGKLTVIGLAEINNGSTYWLCHCDCGGVNTVKNGNLRSGNTGSCGCLKKGANMTHGESKSKLYAVWRGILDRTTNPRSENYHNYGGRGITTSKEFTEFTKFKAYLLLEFGRLPMKGESLDRIDNEGGYAPGNLRYATTKEQTRNTRYNHIVEVYGELLPLISAVEKYGKAKYSTVIARINERGWEVTRALETPARRLRKRT